MTAFRESLAAGLAAVTVAGALAGSTAPAAAWGHGWGGPFAAGAIGGLAAGAIIGGASRPYGYGYGYPAYSGYYAPEPVYNPCYVARRPVYDAYGYFAGYRRTRVCN